MRWLFRQGAGSRGRAFLALLGLAAAVGTGWAACAAPASTPTPPPGVSEAAVAYVEECAEDGRRHGLTLSGVGDEEYDIRLRATERMADSARSMEPPPELAAYREARVALWSTLVSFYEYQIGLELDSDEEVRTALSSALALLAMDDTLRMEEEAKTGMPTPLLDYVSEHCI